MRKINIGTAAFINPMPQTILGTSVNGEPNFMALAWVTRVNYMPPMIGISVNKHNVSSKIIRRTGEFSVNVPSREMVEITDCVGLVSARLADKSQLFKVEYGSLKNAPFIVSCPLNLSCSVTETLTLPTNYLFVGRIVETLCAAECLTEDGKPDVEKLRPFTLSMPDNRFWALGEQVGRAWRDGRPMRDALKRRILEDENETVGD